MKDAGPAMANTPWQQQAHNAETAAIKSLFTFGIPALVAVTMKSFRRWRVRRAERDAIPGSLRDMTHRVGSVEQGLVKLRDDVGQFKFEAVNRHAEMLDRQNQILSQQSKIYELVLAKNRK